MKNSMKFIAVAAAVFLAGILAVVFLGINRRSYKLNLPVQENLAGISVEAESRQAEITDGEEMKALIDMLSGSDNGRTTKEESIRDMPINAQGLLKVDFHFAEKGISTLFVYQKGSQYYIEQPYNGIYKISSDEYNAVEEYFHQ